MSTAKINKEVLQVLEDVRNERVIIDPEYIFTLWEQAIAVDFKAVIKMELIDNELVILDSTPTIFSFTGFRKEDLVGKKISDFIQPRNERKLELILSLLDKGKIVHKESLTIKKDKSLISTEGILVKIFDKKLNKQVYLELIYPLDCVIKL